MRKHSWKVHNTGSSFRLTNTDHLPLHPVFTSLIDKAIDFGQDYSLFSPFPGSLVMVETNAGD